MKKLGLIIALAVLIAACGNNNKQDNKQTKEESTPEEHSHDHEHDHDHGDAGSDEDAPKMVQGMMSFGEEITPDGAIGPDELITQLGDKDSLNAKVKTDITAVCQKKGCWMKLNLGENDEKMMVRFKDYGFFVPKDASGKTAVVSGVVKRKMVPVDELKHYAEDAGKPQEEIDAITEPEEELSFTANGVLIAEK